MEILVVSTLAHTTVHQLCIDKYMNYCAPYTYVITTHVQVWIKNGKVMFTTVCCRHCRGSNCWNISKFPITHLSQFSRYKEIEILHMLYFNRKIAHRIQWATFWIVIIILRSNRDKLISQNCNVWCQRTFETKHVATTFHQTSSVWYHVTVQLTLRVQQ